MKQIINLKYIDNHIELIPDLVLIKDLNGKYIHCNSRYLKFLKKDKKNVIGKTDYDFFSKENSDKFHKEDKKVLNSDQALEFEDSLYIDDNYLHFKTTKQSIFNEEGKLLGLILIVRDITKTKEYQLIYEDNNELLKYISKETDVEKILNKIVNLSERRNKRIKCSILLLDENYLTSGVAPSLPTFYNAANQRFKIGDKVGSCGSAAFRKKRIIVENINLHENWKPYLKLTQKANLHACWSEPIFSSDNKILGTFAMYSNTPSRPTELQLKQLSSYASLAAVAIEKENKRIESDIKIRKQLEKELDAKTEDLLLFKQVVENISYGVTISKANTSNELVYANKAFEDITGYSKKEVIGKNCKLLQNDDINQKGVNILRQSVSQKKKAQVELRNYKKDGTLFYNLINISPVYDQKHEVTHFVGVQRDITQEKHHEVALREQSKLASMGEMIGNIAHQWRQPLSIISTASTGIIMQKEYGLLKEEMLIDTCAMINDNVQYLSKTIDDFSDFIKNKRKKDIFELTNSIDRFLNLVNAGTKSNNINIILNTKEDIQVNGYENELAQCLINIFNNAKDALIEKNIDNKLIFISTFSENDNAIIKIKDNAGGIPENIIHKIFEPYFTTKHQSQGTGLGLHMTYNLIVDGMDGIVKVNNITYNYNDQEYIGAEFEVIIPIDLNKKLYSD